MQGAEDVAVLVDQALARRDAGSRALQALVEEVGVAALCSERRALTISMPRASGTPTCAMLARTRSSRPISTGVPSRVRGTHGGADHGRLFALGEHDALRRAAHHGLHALHHRRSGSRRCASCVRVASMSAIGLRATPVSIAACATAAGCSEIRRGSNGHRDDVIRPEAQARARDRRRRLRPARLAGELRQRLAPRRSSSPR
jgi:hypothetical protein